MKDATTIYTELEQLIDQAKRNPVDRKQELANNILLADIGQDTKIKLLLQLFGRRPTTTTLEEIGREAAKFGFTETLQILIDRYKVNINAQDQYDHAPLHLAAQKGHKDTVQMLIKNGANINAEHNSKTPLHHAAQSSNNDIVQMLIKNGANINALDQYGYSPLHLTAQKGHKDTSQILLKNGADINAKGNNGNTPLHAALYWRRIDVATILIERGADLEAENKESRTALHLAIEKDCTSVVTTMIKKHSNIINTKDVNDRTPFDIAIRYKRQDIAEMLLNMGPICNSTNIQNLKLTTTHHNHQNNKGLSKG